MRVVEFQEVGMENYGPYIDPMIHTFKPNTLTLLTGPNGIGKTMSLDAIPFTLFGVTSKKAKGDDVVNNVVGKNCKTWVKFKVNADQYLVTRYHKYTKLGNTVVINKNGVDTMKGHREVVPEIEKLLCPQKAFMNTLMFGQKVKDFFTDLLDSDKKEIFRKIIGLEQYVLYYKQADNKLKLAQTEYDALSNEGMINQGILDDALEQIEILKDAKKKFYEIIEKEVKTLHISAEDNIRLLETWQLNLAELNKQELDFSSYDSRIATIKNELNNSTSKLTILLDQLDQQKQTKVSEIQSSASEAKIEVKNVTSNKLESMNDNKSQLIHESNDVANDLRQHLHKLDSKSDSIKFEIGSVTESLQEIESNVMNTENSICPTCEQEVTDAAKEKLINRVTLYKGNIDALSQKMDESNLNRNKLSESLKKEIEKYESLIDAVNDEIFRCKQEEVEEYTKIEDRLEVAVKKVSELVSVERKKIENRTHEQTIDLQKEQARIDLKITEIKSSLEEIKKVEETILKINQQIKTITDTITFKESQTYDETQLNSYIKKELDLSDSIMTDKTKMIEIEEKIEIMQFWKTGFSPTGMPSMLIDESIPFMNKKVSKYLDMLTNGRYIVSFDTLDETKAGEFRDKISVRVVDTHTQANSRVQLSGGQTRIVDIATILTLGDLQSTINDVTFNILLFDEIFDALDYDNVGYVSKVLNKLKIDKSIFIISHQLQDQLEPDELLTLN